MPAAAWAFLRFLDIAAVASTWVSIPVYANTSIINVCSPPRVGIHRHSPAGAPGGVVRFLYDDPGQAGPLDSRVGTLCPSPAQFEAASPFRPIAGEAELECFLSNKLRLLVPAATERICLDRGFGCRRGVNAPLLFLSIHTLPPPYTGVRLVPVSAWRFIVVTMLTEGSIFVGSCEVDGGLRLGSSPLWVTGKNNEGRSLHGLTSGLLDIAAVACTGVSIPLS